MDWKKIRRYSREDLLDKIQGMECDLDSAVDLMIRVARREQTRDEMGRWVSLNYSQFREKLPKRLRELPPKRRQVQ